MAGYRVLRDGTTIATVTSTSYTDNWVTSSGSHDYALVAFDVVGNALLVFLVIMIAVDATSSATPWSGRRDSHQHLPLEGDP